MDDDAPGSEGQWYYADGDAPKGPLGVEEIRTALRDGRIRPNTLVWREGWPQWRLWSDVSAGFTAGADPADLTCVECGRAWPAASMIEIAGRRVCVQCKPSIVQRAVEQGVLPGADRTYAGFWIRFAATFLDGIVVGVAYNAVYLPVYFGVMLPAMRSTEEPNMRVFLAVFGLVWLFGIVLQAGYEIWMVGRWGGTLGKLACRLRIVTADGGRVSYGRATGRHFAKYLSQFTMGIGYLLAAFDREKRALHDMVCDTRVVRI